MFEISLNHYTLNLIGFLNPVYSQMITILNCDILDGAALMYTSVKEGRNIGNFYKYLIHRIYDFPLRIPPQVVEKDAIFMLVFHLILIIDLLVISFL